MQRSLQWGNGTTPAFSWCGLACHQPAAGLLLLAPRKQTLTHFRPHETWTATLAASFAVPRVVCTPSVVGPAVACVFRGRWRELWSPVPSVYDGCYGPAHRCCCVGAVVRWCPLWLLSLLTPWLSARLARLAPSRILRPLRRCFTQGPPTPVSTDGASPGLSREVGFNSSCAPGSHTDDPEWCGVGWTSGWSRRQPTNTNQQRDLAHNRSQPTETNQH